MLLHISFWRSWDPATARLDFARNIRVALGWVGSGWGRSRAALRSSPCFRSAGCRDGVWQRVESYVKSDGRFSRNHSINRFSSSVLLFLLPRIQDASWAGEGLTGLEADRAARRGTGLLGAYGRRSASSILPPGCVTTVAPGNPTAPTWPAGWDVDTTNDALRPLRSAVHDRVGRIRGRPFGSTRSEAGGARSDEVCGTDRSLWCCLLTRREFEVSDPSRGSVPRIAGRIGPYAGSSRISGRGSPRTQGATRPPRVRRMGRRSGGLPKGIQPIQHDGGRVCARWHIDRMGGTDLG
jgi:hypothetical protein